MLKTTRNQPPSDGHLLDDRDDCFDDDDANQLSVKTPFVVSLEILKLKSQIDYVAICSAVVFDPTMNLRGSGVV